MDLHEQRKRNTAQNLNSSSDMMSIKYVNRITESISETIITVLR